MAANTRIKAEPFYTEPSSGWPDSLTPRPHSMMTSISPIEPANGHRSNGSGYGSGQSDGSKSPLSMSLGILKTLTEKKNTRVDGQEPKRRGPKPDSKPALTRRQELNRQAQRTHRERKELYIKGLEVEVNRLKDNFANVARDKMSLAEENRQLKQLLATHGINWSGNGGAEEFDFTNISNHVNGSSNRGASSTGYTSGSSISGTYASGSAAYSPPPLSNGPRSLNQSPTSPHHFSSNGVMNMNGNLNSSRQHQGLAMHNEEYDQQSGIDFVLTLERPCMEHMQILVERSEPSPGESGEIEKPGETCGHVLMASCPPSASPDNSVPWAPVSSLDAANVFKFEDEDEDLVDFAGKDGTLDMTGRVIEQKTWDIPTTDLASLMNLSKRLDLDGEITPVHAWGMVLAHERFLELGADEIKELAGELVQKVRCYGFGAVLEEFEVRDALDALFFRKPDPMMLTS